MKIKIGEQIITTDGESPSEVEQELITTVKQLEALQKSYNLAIYHGLKQSVQQVRTQMESLHARYKILSRKLQEEQKKKNET